LLKLKAGTIKTQIRKLEPSLKALLHLVTCKGLKVASTSA
jgi:hypothetical protein